jgi:hypothetical protein
VQAVVPSWQSPVVTLQVPGDAKQQVTKPDFPHVDRAAHRVTEPRQLGGRPFATAFFSSRLTQLTYWPWLVAAVQTHTLAMVARAASAAAGSSQRAPALVTHDPETIRVARTMTSIRDLMSPSFPFRRR